MVEIRKLRDIDALIAWRREVILNVFGAHPDDKSLTANRQYYARHIADDSHTAFVALADGTECGCGAACFTDELPSPDNPSGRCAYLMNIYVRGPFRRQGVAHAIMRSLIDEARERGCGKIYLETTAEGKAVYSSVGFRDMPDMMKYHSAED